jgi:hypothetical protein
MHPTHLKIDIMFSKFCKFTSNVVKMVIYKNAVILYFNILFTLLFTLKVA